MPAMLREVVTGFAKPTSAKMVAEKYMREFCDEESVSWPACDMDEKVKRVVTYKAA